MNAGPEQDAPVVEAAGPPTFEGFYRTNLLAMVRLAHVITGSNAIAEDLVHEAFLKVRPRLATLRNPDA
jgi:DNA-directed RNA polymerase specialized sigma24 family protein